MVGRLERGTCEGLNWLNGRGGCLLIARISLNLGMSCAFLGCIVDDMAV